NARPTPSTSKYDFALIGISEVDGLAAAAGTLDVRVLELEAVAHEPGDEIERRAVEVEQALLVDEDLHGAAVGRDELEHAVARLGGLVGPLEGVGEAVAAAAAQPDTQPERGLALGLALRRQLGDLRQRRLGGVDLELDVGLGARRRLFAPRRRCAADLHHP